MDEIEADVAQPEDDSAGADGNPRGEDGPLVPVATARGEWEWDSAPEPESGRTWRQELPRWLATLDAPSTRREYEKAVRYFFETPGVPQVLGDLTYDLLLAYRGSLARRAERGVRPTGGRVANGVASIAGGQVPDALPGPTAAAAGSGGDDEAEGEGDAEGARSGARRTGPLAPATANLRITALRRFLAHCALWALVPQLSADRVAAALRRLRIERRRPYQVLAEPEWEAFLAAARGPAVAATGASGQQQTEDEVSASEAAQTQELAHSPWGMPRAVRRRLAEDAGVAGPARTQRRAELAAATPVRSRAGLTGARTARRDHALLALALATGLRAVELCALDVADLHREWHGGREEWWLILPDEKTKGQRGGRTLPLGAELTRTLLEYVSASGRRWERPHDRATPLFLSNRRRSTAGKADSEAPTGRLTTPQVRRIVDRVEAQWAAGAGKGYGGGDGLAASQSAGRAISPHALRHSTAVALLEGNEVAGRPPASVEHVRGWLGHFDIRTTQGYLAHVDSRRHRRPFALDPVRPESDGETSEAARRDDAGKGN